MAELGRLKDRPYTKNRSTGGYYTFPEQLGATGIIHGVMNEMRAVLGDPTCLESSGSTTFPTLIMAVAHDFLNLYGDETSAPLTPWRKCGIFVVKSFTGGEDESNRVLEQISPFLNQYLIHLTIESRFDELSPAQDTRIAKLLALSHNRASILLATLDIEQRLAQRLRSFWVEEAEKGRARWLKGNTGD